MDRREEIILQTVAWIAVVVGTGVMVFALMDAASRTGGCV